MRAPYDPSHDGVIHSNGNIVGGALEGVGKGISEKARRDWESSERTAHEKWASGESSLDRQWKTWNEQGNRDWQSAEYEKSREFQERLQGNMFQQQKDLARLNAELRGYSTPGATYGLNQAGNQSGGAQVPPRSQNFTPGTFDAGRSGLGYGQPRAQPRIRMQSGQTTEFGTDSGTSANITDINSPIQPQEFRSTGAARLPATTDADRWLNNQVIASAKGSEPYSVGVRSSGINSTGLSQQDSLSGVPGVKSDANAWLDRNLGKARADAWLDRNVSQGLSAPSAKPASHRVITSGQGVTRGVAPTGESNSGPGLLASAVYEEGKKSQEAQSSAVSALSAAAFA